MIKVAITGAAGRMGRTLIQAVMESEGVELSVALDHPGSSMLGVDAVELAGIGKLGIAVTSDLTACKHIVIGTTGFDETEKNKLLMQGIISWLFSHQI